MKSFSNASSSFWYLFSVTTAKWKLSIPLQMTPSSYYLLLYRFYSRAVPQSHLDHSGHQEKHAALDLNFDETLPPIPSSIPPFLQTHASKVYPKPHANLSPDTNAGMKTHSATLSNHQLPPPLGQHGDPLPGQRSDGPAPYSQRWRAAAAGGFRCLRCGVK